MEYNEVKILVEKYFDGNTSLEEEKLLSQYLSQCQELPQEFQGVKMMLASLHELKEATPAKVEAEVATTIERKPRWRVWSYYLGAGIAASVAIVMLLTTLYRSENSGLCPEIGQGFICYVDGEEINDWSIAHAETDRILSGVASNMEQAMSGIRNLQIPILDNND